MNNIITKYESKFLSGRQSLPLIKPGMQVRVHQKIKEADGKDRIQMYEGLVIKAQGSSELNYRITVRKIASGIGVEKVFPVHSPVIDKIEVTNMYKVRRADLKHVRNMTKADRMKEDREGLKRVLAEFEKAEAEQAKAKEEAPKAEVTEEKTKSA